MSQPRLLPLRSGSCQIYNSEIWESGMTGILKTILLGLALAGVPAGYVFYSAILSPNDWVFGGSSPSDWRDSGLHGAHGAPGPVMGAGLPVLLVAGGVWL